MSLQWLGLLLGVFDPWPGNFYMLQVQPKKKNQKNKKNPADYYEQSRYILDIDSTGLSEVVGNEDRKGVKILIVVHCEVLRDFKIYIYIFRFHI